MSYIALARKWRPRTFSQLIGQEHINKALSNSLNQNRLHHAYLFTGTRGVGKTSVARLLAKALNCEKGISADPCLLCEACLAIEQGRFIDLIEIDGASRTRVEDTRDILENVQYMPTSGRFKIYLIDEVHMLSQHSFNALLKTLEEPPTHVKFLLATTDPQKLPITVLSRCLQFNLKHLQADVIMQHLEHILADEKLSYDKPALELLAKAARGSMRDALSLLDQAIASCGNHLQLQEVKNNLGYTQQDYALQLLQALAEIAPQKLMSISKQIAMEGGHFHYVIDEMLCYLHQISISQSIPNENPFILPSPETLTLSSEFTPEDVQLLYQIGLKSTEDLHLAPTFAIGFDMMLLRMYTFRPAVQQTTPPLAYQTSQARSNSPTKEQANMPTDIKPTTQTQPFIVIPDNNVCHTTPTNRTSPQTLESPAQDFQSKSQDRTVKTLFDPCDIAKSEDTNWSSILQKLELSGLALSAAENAEFIHKSETELALRVAKGHLSVFTTAVIARIEQGLAKHYKKVLKLTLSSDEVVLSSPAQQRHKTQQKLHEDAEIALLSDPFFQQLQEEFSAELVRNSITPLKDDL